MKKIAGKVLRALGLGPRLHHLRQEEWRWKSRSLWVPPGHYYSPVFTRENLAEEEARISRPIPRHLPGIQLDEEAMVARLGQMGFVDKPFQPPQTQDPAWRYWIANQSYEAGDAWCLAGIARIFQPKRLIEVGCGFSSALIHDLNEREWNQRVDLSFVDPDPERMMRLLRPEDKTRLKLTRSRLQDMDPGFFTTLQANDILFIDSTHVAKTGSDVLFLFFELLPRLAPGVVIHIHDISWPFEYPRQWLEEGRSWNENYLLRAFLMHNNAYEILLCNTWIGHFRPDAWHASLPGVPLDGGNMWIRKVHD